MARFNEILVGRYNRFLQKFLSMKGGPPAPQLASELSATWALFHGRENRYLEAWNTFAARFGVNAVAAQDTVIRFRNPVGSNVIAVVESMRAWFTVANTEYDYDFSPTDQPALSATNTPASFDNRFQPPGTGNNGAQCTISGSTNIGAAGFVSFADLIKGLVNDLTDEYINFENQEIVLAPGSALQLRTLTLNVGVTFSIRWRERPLEESERT